MGGYDFFIFWGGLALLAAIFFGVGDFCGGLAARRATAYQVLAVSSSVATGLMSLMALVN